MRVWYVLSNLYGFYRTMADTNNINLSKTKPINKNNDLVTKCLHVTEIMGQVSLDLKTSGRASA